MKITLYELIKNHPPGYLSSEIVDIAKCSRKVPALVAQRLNLPGIKAKGIPTKWITKDTLKIINEIQPNRGRKNKKKTNSVFLRFVHYIKIWLGLINGHYNESTRKYNTNVFQEETQRYIYGMVRTDVLTAQIKDKALETVKVLIDEYSINNKDTKDYLYNNGNIIPIKQTEETIIQTTLSIDDITSLEDALGDGFKLWLKANSSTKSIAILEDVYVG
jgi:hypothetical protein